MSQRSFFNEVDSSGILENNLDVLITMRDCIFADEEEYSIQEKMLTYILSFIDIYTHKPITEFDLDEKINLLKSIETKETEAFYETIIQLAYDLPIRISDFNIVTDPTQRARLDRAVNFVMENPVSDVSVYQQLCYLVTVAAQSKGCFFDLNIQQEYYDIDR